MIAWFAGSSAFTEEAPLESLLDRRGVAFADMVDTPPRVRVGSCETPSLPGVADNRNITLHAEYNHENRVFGSEIPWLRSQDNFSVIDLDTGGLPNGSDGFPDRTFFRDIRSSTIHRSM